MNTHQYATGPGGGTLRSVWRCAGRSSYWLLKATRTGISPQPWASVGRPRASSDSGSPGTGCQRLSTTSRRADIHSRGRQTLETHVLHATLRPILPPRRVGPHGRWPGIWGPTRCWCNACGAHGLKPHLVHPCKLSRDPHFREKVEDVLSSKTWMPSIRLLLSSLTKSGSAAMKSWGCKLLAQLRAKRVPSSPEAST